MRDIKLITTICIKANIQYLKSSSHKQNKQKQVDLTYLKVYLHCSLARNFRKAHKHQIFSYQL